MMNSYNSYRLKSGWLTLVLLSLGLFHSSSYAGLIAFDLHDNRSLNLIEYNNPLQDEFSHSVDDSFQVHQQGVTEISDGLLDDSKSRTDRLGIIEANEDFESFFAVQDLNNPRNPLGQETASWIFDIQHSRDLSFSLDIAAMGDFELSDWFRWDYSIDNLERKTLFDLRSEQQRTQAYQMASGSIVTLNDPLSINNQLLDNHFTNISTPILGHGFQLKLFFTAQQNGGNEILAFRNLMIEGEKTFQSSATIPAPTTTALLLLGLCGLWVQKSRAI